MIVESYSEMVLLFENKEIEDIENEYVILESDYGV